MFALAGTLLASCLHAVVFPGAFGLDGLDLKYLFVVLGNIPAALSLGLLVSLRARKSAHRMPRGASVLAFWFGVAVGLGGLIGSWFTNHGGPGEGWRFAVPVVTALLLLLALQVQKLGAPSFRFVCFFSGAGVAAALILMFGIGASELRLASRDPQAQPFPVATTAAEGPDVLLISIDTLRAADLLRSDIPTPAIDVLAQRSLRADYALSPGPSATPSYMGLLSGKPTLQTGTRISEGSYTPHSNATSLVEDFREAGWLTLGVGWDSLVDDQEFVAKGFDIFQNLASIDSRIELRHYAQRGSWLGWILPSPIDSKILGWLSKQRIHGLEEDLRLMLLGRSPGAATTRLAEDYLSQLSTHQSPYFFFLHFVDLHQPYLPDPRFQGKLTADATLPSAYRDELHLPTITDHISADLQSGSEEAKVAAEYLHLRYLEELMFVDECIGRVLAAVDQSKRPTVIVLTSNHGELFGEHNQMAHPEEVYEELLRVPLLIAGPNVEPENMESSPYLTDVIPTIMGLCGLEIPAGLEGRNLLAPTVSPRFHVATGASTIAVYDGNWKTVFEHHGLAIENAKLKPIAVFNLVDPVTPHFNLLNQGVEVTSSQVVEASQWIRRQLGDFEAVAK